MDSPGINVKPIRDLSGGTELCQTFFDDVRVPHANLIGAVNQGWSVANALLGLERIYVGLPKHSAHALARFHDLLTLTGAWDDPEAVDRYVQLQFDLDAHVALYESAIARIKATGTYPPETKPEERRVGEERGNKSKTRR